MKVTAYWISGFCLMIGLTLRLNELPNGGKLILAGLIIFFITFRSQKTTK